MPKELSYEEEIRRRITKKYNNRSEFYGHLVSYLIFNGVMWGVFEPSGGWYTVAMAITGLWGMGLAIHVIQFIMNEARENAIEKAIERERQWRGAAQIPEPEMKRKRRRLSDLADDGEIEIIEDDEAMQGRQ